MPSVLGVENDCSRFPISAWLQLLDSSPFPHMAGSHLLLQEDVSNAKLRFPSAGLLKLVIRAQFQQVLLCPSLPDVLDDLLLELEFLC